MFSHPPGKQLALIAMLLIVSSGCVSRRMTIRTDPPGALVEVDGQRLGLSPVSMDFTYYGTHEITLSAPGYETVTLQQPVARPWHQAVPVDFVSNHFLGTHITDRHDFVYHLRPRQKPLNEEVELIDRGQNFRSQSQVGPLP